MSWTQPCPGASAACGHTHHLFRLKARQGSGALRPQAQWYSWQCCLLTPHLEDWVWVCPGQVSGPDVECPTPLWGCHWAGLRHCTSSQALSRHPAVRPRKLHPRQDRAQGSSWDSGHTQTRSWSTHRSQYWYWICRAVRHLQDQPFTRACGRCLPCPHPTGEEA